MRACVECLSPSAGGHVLWSINGSTFNQDTVEPGEMRAEAVRRGLERSLEASEQEQWESERSVDFPTKITTHVKPSVTAQSNCLVIFVANRNGDPRNRVSQKHSPRSVGTGALRVGKVRTYPCIALDLSRKIS